MHEYSVTKSLVDLCNQEAEKNKFVKIYKINLKIGKFTGLFDEIPIRIKCKDCGKENIIDEPILMCPNCGKTDIEIVSGREFYVESIEGE
jgi:hydrogenase nickel incorporation protein HypA/HybF